MLTWVFILQAASFDNIWNSIECVINLDDIWRYLSKTFDIWVERYLTIIWRYLTTETFTLEPENYRPKDIVKYRHLSPSGNRAYETVKIPCKCSNNLWIIKVNKKPDITLSAMHYVYVIKFQLESLLWTYHISCSTCCLVGPVKATWVCASFDSNLVIISCSKYCSWWWLD